jgi:hypothetical protein
VYIFQPSKRLLISRNGKVEKGTWENIGDNSILIDVGGESYLFKHGFFDKNILALKLDGINEYAFLINESRFSGELDSIDRILNFLSSNYLNGHMPKKLKEKVNPLELNLPKKDSPSLNELTRSHLKNTF